MRKKTVFSTNGISTNGCAGWGGGQPNPSHNPLTNPDQEQVTDYTPKPQDTYRENLHKRQGKDCSAQNTNHKEKTAKLDYTENKTSGLRSTVKKMKGK